MTARILGEHPLPAECDWCGRVDCPDRFDHDRLSTAHETTWREAAR